MTDFVIENLCDADYGAWCKYIQTCYYSGHILCDWPHLKWYFGQAPGTRHDVYETLVAKTPDGQIVGSYGVLPATLAVDGRDYRFCWFASGMVHPEHRNLGLGKRFVAMLADRFQTCGGIGFNVNVKRNYERAGFALFGDRTARRFVYTLQPQAFELVRAIGFDAEAAQALAPLKSAKSSRPAGASSLQAFEPAIEQCHAELSRIARVCVHRTAAYLNWRYFQNPRLTYEVSAIDWRGYVVSRREMFLPTHISGMRVVDLSGEPNTVKDLLVLAVERARERGDALVDVSLIGASYAPVLQDAGFVELVGPQFEWWPLVSTPIERRENHEHIFLGSFTEPGMFHSIRYEDLHFTRGDADRDRANRVRQEPSTGALPP